MQMDSKNPEGNRPAVPGRMGRPDPVGDLLERPTRDGVHVGCVLLVDSCLPSRLKVPRDASDHGTGGYGRAGNLSILLVDVFSVQ